MKSRTQQEAECQGTLKAAAEYNNSHHLQPQTKENFMKKSRFSIKPCTVGRSPTPTAPHPSPTSQSSLRTVAAGVRRHRPLAARTRRGHSPASCSPSLASDPTPFRTQGATAAPRSTRLLVGLPQDREGLDGKGDRGWGPAGSAPARRPAGGSFSTTSRRTAAGTAAPREAGQREDGRRGLALPGRGQQPPSRAYLRSGRTRTGRCGETVAGRGVRPRGPLSVLRLLLAGRQEAATRHSRPGRVT